VNQLKHPATIIAAVALFLALGGGAWAGATGLISGSKIKNNSIGVKKLTKAAVKSLHALPKGTTLRGVFLAEGQSTGVHAATVGDNISFGWTLNSAPTEHFIKVGDAVPSGCSGTPENPGAAPGNLCVFEVENLNVDDSLSEVWSPPADNANDAEAYGAAVYTRSAGAGVYEFGGSWAVTAP
jgi:hypothetical protein